MDFGLPDWLDIAKISGLAVLTMAVVQYFKANVPEKYIRYFAVLVGIGLSFACDCYTGAQVRVVRAILNGVMAAVLSDLGYSMLSKKGGSSLLTLPSKSDLDKKNGKSDPVKPPPSNP